MDSEKMAIVALLFAAVLFIGALHDASNKATAAFERCIETHSGDTCQHILR